MRILWGNREVKKKEEKGATTPKRSIFRQDDASSQQAPDTQKTCARLRPSEMVVQDGPRTSLARLPIHGAGHQTQEAAEAGRSRRQSFGQDRQTARHRLQSGQEFARQVESRRQDDQGHQQVTGEENLTERILKRIMQAKKRFKL